jgi:hypothetical protein
VHPRPESIEDARNADLGEARCVQGSIVSTRGEGQKSSSHDMTWLVKPGARVCVTQNMSLRQQKNNRRLCIYAWHTRGRSPAARRHSTGTQPPASPRRSTPAACHVHASRQSLHRTAHPRAAGRLPLT